MAIKLVRESSETPNITNKDDTKMIRYAYGGYTGFVKDYENELSHSISGSILKINSGRIVLGGWEIDIAENSWELDLSAISGTQYYTIYIEANIATEIVQIKSSYASGAYPNIEEGDDLTKYPSGMARAVLYHVKSVNGSLSEIEKIIEPIPYLKEIEERLERLGFRQGELTFPDEFTSPIEGIVTRQGNYVIGRITVTGSVNLMPAVGLPFLIATIPENFRPKNKIIIMTTWTTVSTLTGSPVPIPIQYNITEDGEIYAEFIEVTGAYMPGNIPLHDLSFGYEANPL